MGTLAITVPFHVNCPASTKLFQIPVHLAQMSSDILLELTGDGVALSSEPLIPQRSRIRLWTMSEFRRVGEICRSQDLEEPVVFPAPARGSRRVA